MKRNDSGAGLLIVLFTMAFVSALVAVVYTVTNTHTRVTRRVVDRTAAVAFADAVLESLYDQWRQAMISVTNATDRKDGLTNSALAAVLQAPNSIQLPPRSGISLGSWSVVAATPLLAPLTGSSLRPAPENGTSSSLRVRLHYLASATVNFPGPSGNQSVTVQRAFVRAGRNIFDDFFFGTQKKVEFHPGPPMYVDGTVYIGGDLYTAHDSLHFLKDVTFTGTHTLNYRAEDSRISGSGAGTPITTNGLGDNWDLNNPPRVGQEQKLFDTKTDQLDPNFLDDPIANDTNSDGNPNNDGYRELIEEKVSGHVDPLQLDSGTSERLVSNADYRIYVDAANTVTIYKGASTTPLPTSGTSAAAVEYATLKNALTTNTALRDVRDGDNVRLVTMDVDKIRVGHSGGKISDNVGGTGGSGGDGLTFYVSDRSVGTSVSTKVVNSLTGTSTSVTSSRARGLKLINGSKLPSIGMTVVSPNPVYIQGDYNSGKTSTTQPASNTAASYVPPVDRPSPFVSGYSHPASAVVGDAVNILSNNWNDANSLLPKSSRLAFNTTINTAIVAGNVPTTTSSYSGGVENFVRFHEDWSNDYLTIYGALALLYDSAQATRPWSLADYSPPNRRWFYDTLFMDSNPPGFHFARSYERGKWMLR